MTVEPPVPADADLRDFAFMPLDINRLFGSSFHARASDAEWRAGVTLWLRSFHQVPAGSLPQDDIELCRLAELGRDLRAWGKIKAGAMHGWFLCGDGRFYHATVAEKANEAWRRKSEQRQRTQKARTAALDKRLGRLRSQPDEGRVEPPSTVSAAGSVTDSVTATKGEGQGQGESRRSEPEGSGGAPPAGSGLARMVFGQGVEWLRGVTGKPDAHCRSLIGRWRKSVGDAVLIELLAEAQRQDIQAPEAWITAAIRARERAGPGGGAGGPMPATAEQAMEQFEADPAWRGVAS